MTQYLTPEQVLFIHARVIGASGGEHGVRDLGLLAAAIARPQATFDQQELYPDNFSKAAALLESLVLNHPFVDGNKRTGIASAALFLRRNGWRMQAGNSDLARFTLRVADQHVPLREIADWLQDNCVREL